MKNAMTVPQLTEELVRIHGSANAAARACEMPEGTFHRLRSGERKDPRLKTLRHLARGFDKPLSWVAAQLEGEAKEVVGSR